MSEHKYGGLPLSYGAGVNSTALAIRLVSEGWRGPIVYSDTGTEWPETAAYVETFRDWLAPRGLELTVLDSRWRGRSYAPALIDYCEQHRVTPLPARRWCTYRWKTEPLEKWCLANGFRLHDMLIGISVDEARRQPARIRPLVEWDVDRKQCTQIIAEANLPLPRKSGCWICPFQRVSQWRELYVSHPDLFRRAALLEEAATARRADGRITHFGRTRGITLRDLQRQFDAQPALLTNPSGHAKT